MDALWQWDRETFRAVHLGLHRDWLDPVFWIITSTGLGYVQVAGILLAALWAGLRGSAETLWNGFTRSLHDWGWSLLLAFALSGALNTLILKKLILRDRPSRLAWALPQEEFFARSFPSGHTATAWGIAFALLLISLRAQRPWIAIVAVVWAALVGFSRVYRGVHWPTDVLGGALVGILAGCIAFLATHRKSRLEAGSQA